MYRGNWGRAVLSRVAAVALLCLLTAWLAGVLRQIEAAEIDKMTHQELKQYVQEDATASFGERYLIILVGTAVLVALVEALAAGLRALVPSFPEPVASEPPSPLTPRSNHP